MGKTRSPLRALVALSTVLAVSLALSGGALAAHTIDLGESGTDQSGECQGDYFKIEDAESMLVEGTHTYIGTTKEGASFSATLTVVLDADGEVESIEVVSTDPDYVLIVFKGGTEFETTTGTTIVMSDGKAISNVAFCLGGPPATDPPATDPPATDPPATDPPATDPPATDPPATDPPATDPPATQPPALTPPPTSMSDTGSGSGPANTLLVLLVGAMAAAWLLLRPMAPSAVRAGRRGQR
jgi:hypothetical protein